MSLLGYLKDPGWRSIPVAVVEKRLRLHPCVVADYDRSVAQQRLETHCKILANGAPALNGQTAVFIGLFAELNSKR